MVLSKLIDGYKCKSILEIKYTKGCKNLYTNSKILPDIFSHFKTNSLIVVFFHARSNV